MEQDFYNQGKIKAEKENYEEAIALFSKALEIDPYFADIYYQRGLAYFNLGQTYNAIANFDQAINLDSKHQQAYYSRALAKVSLKNLLGSFNDINKSISLNLNYAPAYELKGSIHLKKGEISSAIASFEKAANLYLTQKNAEGCRRCLQFLEKIKPSGDRNSNLISGNSSSPSVNRIKNFNQNFYNEILTQVEKGQIQKALQELNWVLEIDAKDINAYLCRAIIYRKTGKLLRAIADYNQVLRLNPQNEIASSHRGKMRIQLKDYHGAINDLNEALKSNSQQADLFLSRAEAYSAIGDYQKAIEDYTKVLILNPEESFAYFYRAKLYLNLKETKKAIIDYQTAANMFFEKENWHHYYRSLELLKQINVQKN